MGDGTTKNTAAFAAAIAACHRAGGGHVIVPAGTFLTGAIHLLSNVDLHVGTGATVLFSQDLPPQMIQPFASDTVLLEGVTVINSPFCHLNPNLCRNVTVDGLTIRSSGPNTDGCDPESCDGVVVQNVTYVVIQNCDFADGHGGITIGSEMTGGVKNVYARDLTMNSANLQAGHRIKTNTLRGGYVLNTNVYRVKAGPVGTATLDRIAITTSTAANSAVNIANLVVEDVTVGGTPVTV